MKTILTLFVFLFWAVTITAQEVDMAKTKTTTQTVSQHKVKVFPNPATNVVNVLGLKNSPKAAIRILDIYGNVVLEHQWEIRRNAINIPISTLVPGAYIVTIHSKEQRIRTKFYKQ